MVANETDTKPEGIRSAPGSKSPARQDASRMRANLASIVVLKLFNRITPRCQALWKCLAPYGNCLANESMRQIKANIGTEMYSFWRMEKSLISITFSSLKS